MEASGERAELGRAGALLVLAVLVAGAFAPVLSGGFLFLDDNQNFASNLSFRGFSAQHLRWMLSTSHMGNWQPVSWLTHALDFALFGLDGPRFHQASVAWHVAVSALFFVAAERLLVLAGVGAGPGGARRARLAALLAALAFALHPLRGESVAWLSGRNDVVAGLFFVPAVLAWLRYARLGAPGPPPAPRPRLLSAGVALALAAAALARLALVLEPGELIALAPGGPALLAAAGACAAASLDLVPRALGAPGAARLAYALAWLAAALSLSAKGYGVVLPGVLLLLDAWPLRRVERARAALGERGGALRAWLVLAAEKAPFVAASFVCSQITVWAKAASDLRALSEHSVLERAWQAAYGLAFYVRKSVLPTDLSPMYDLPADVRIAEPRFLLSLLAVLAAVALAWRARRRFPGLLAALAGYALLIAPSLGLLQSGAQLVADRYSYLATMPLALGLGALWAGADRRGGAASSWAGAAALAAVLALGVATWRGAARWADPVGALAHGIETTRSPRLMTNLAMTYNEAAASEGAPRAQLLALALEWSERALAEAEARDLEDPRYRLHHGTILYNLGRAEEAVADLEWYVAREPASVEGHLNLGLALERAGRAELAAASFERCLEIAPGHPVAAGHLGRLRGR